MAAAYIPQFRPLLENEEMVDNLLTKAKEYINYIEHGVWEHGSEGD